jgi:hypothetical protein
MTKKLWRLVFLAWLGLVVSVVFLSAFGVRKTIDVAQTEGDLLFQIWGSKEVGQTFRARQNNLDIIILDLKNPALKNQQPIFFRLREVGAGQDLVEVKINGLNIGDPSSVRFQFSPIPDSAGKNYYFYLVSPASTEKEPIEVYYSPQNLYPEGEMMVDGQKKEAELRFTSFFHPGSKKKIAQEMIKDFLTRFWQDKGFLIFYLGILFLLMILGFKSGDQK